MNRNIITNQSIKGCHPTVKTQRNQIVRTLQVLLTTIIMLFALGLQGAWADIAVLSSPTGSVATHSDDKNVVTVTDGSSNTGIQQGSGTFNIEGESYTPMKLSGSRQFNITYSNKVNINSVTLYYRENNTTGTATLGTSSSDRTSIGTMPDKNSNPAFANISSITGLNASAQFMAVIVVDYTPKQGVEESHDATLKSITVYGSEIAGFASATKSYNVQLAYGTTVVPTVGAASTDANATVNVIQASALPGAATINVTAEDGTTTDTYTLNLSVSSVAPTIPDGYDKFWYANDWDKMTASTTPLSINDITINNVAVDATTYNGVEILGNVTQRFNFGGAGAINGRRIEIPVDGPCEIQVWGANNNVGRCIVLHDGTNSLAELCTTTDDNKGQLLKESYTYKGEAKTLYLYSKTGGFYVIAIGIKSTEAPSDPAGPVDLSAELAAQNTPQGWTAVSLPNITINTTQTLDNLTQDENNAPKIQAAIDAASTAGGGKVVIPAGEWLSGQLFIKSNVVLHLSKNCTLKMLPYGTYPAAKENYFIGTGSEIVNDVIIEGEDYTSIIDGQGAGWWTTFDANNDTRPAGLVRFRKGTRYLVRNIQFQNSPKPNLVLGDGGNASHFTVHDVKIVNPSSDSNEATADGFAGASHNTDGIPVWGPYCNIYKCNISTGDDNIVFDSNAQYCHVWDCDFGRGHGASIGSNTMNVHDILWDNIRFNGTQSGFKIKTDRGKGNELYNITYQNSTMTGVRDILYMDSFYGSSTKPTPGTTAATTIPEGKESPVPAWHDITYKNITATNCVYKQSDKNGFPIYFYGLPESHIKNVTIDNVTIEGQKGMFMAYVGENDANGVTFQNGCSITNIKEPTAAAFVINYSAVHNDDYVTASEPKSSEKTLTKAVFSNGFDAFINENSKTVTAYYMQGESAPTLVTKEQSAKATTSIDGNTITVTAEDGTTQDYALTLAAVAPYTTTGEHQFDGTETWVKTGGAYTIEANSKIYYAWVINKNADDGRIQLGKTRIYFFVGNSDKITLINDRGTSLSSDRAIKVYVNGEEKSTPTSMPKYNSETPASIDIETGGSAMIEIAANQTSGDTGWGKIIVTPKSADPEPTPTTPEWESIEMTLNAAGLLTTEDMTKVDDAYPNVDFGISVDNTGKVIRVEKDAANAIGSISGKYHSDHGMNPFTMKLNVPGAVKITAGTCTYGTTQVKVNDVAAGDAVVGGGNAGPNICWKSNHANVVTGLYNGAAGEIEIKTGSYTPYIKIEQYNAADEPQADPDGIYDLVVENVAQLKSALTHSGTAEKQFKILVKNGTYDLGTDIQTPVKDYVSLIGESKDGVIIQNEPTQEGIQTSVLLLVSGTGTDIENMTLKCTVANSGSGERSVVIWDKGQDNIFRNLKLVGRQDTYSSDGKPEGAKSYFEDCHIMGTVDFICGSGNVMFENCILDLQQRSSGDVITAPSTHASETGFVFNNCTIQGDIGQAGKYYLARGWKNDPKATFINTTMKIAPASGGISPSDASQSVNSKTWKEYGSKNASGEAANVTSSIISESDANTITTGVVGTLGTDTSTELIELEEPVIEDSKLKWKSDPRAIGYIIYKNGTKVATVAASTSSAKGLRAAAATEDMEYAIDDPSAAWSVSAINAMGAVGKAAAVPVAPDPTPAYPITATWDFKNGVPVTISSVNIQGKTDVAASDKDGIELAVDATVDKGKFAASSNASGKFAQFNTGTIIKVPVTSKYDIVTVEAFPGQAKYTVGGVPATENVEHRVSEAEANQGYVEIVATGNGYINSITVTQQGPDYVPTESWEPTWDATNNRWVVKTSNNADPATKATENAKGLTEALKFLNTPSNVAGKNKTLYIPNGTYDLGETAKTPVNSGMHLIGESENGVIIKNQLPIEVINNTATLYITRGATDVVIENLTLRCRATYGITTGGVASNAERGVCVQDEGRNTHYIHVTMDGLQDTYYSNGDAGMKATFDECTVMGNVDFFCGSGDITVNNSTLVVVPCKNSGSRPVICAPATYTTGETQGYLFNNCTIVDGTRVDQEGVSTNISQDLNYHLARAWYSGNQTDKTPRVTFQDTKLEINPLEYWTTMGSTQPGGAPIFNFISNLPEYSQDALVIDTTNRPFGFVTATDRTNPASINPSNITGGGAVTIEEAMTMLKNGEKGVVRLTSDGVTDMKATIYNAIKNNKVIIFDGSVKTDFIVSEVMNFKSSENSSIHDKTIIGINGARICTQFFITERYKNLLDNVPTPSGTGVTSASTAAGTGGTFKMRNGVEVPVNEGEEYYTRMTLYNAVADAYEKKAKQDNGGTLPDGFKPLATEPYRYAGLFYLDGCYNIIFRNLKLVGPGSVDVGGTDLMSIITGSHHIWVDHCEFTDGIDGNFDITDGSDFVTVSWCKFGYTDRAYAHENTNLVGSDDNKVDMDSNKLNVTFAYNEWGKGCDGRMPMARFGKIHMLNNYYTCYGNTQNAMNPRKNSEFLIEGNLWAKGVTKTYKEDGALNVTWGAGNVIKDPAGTQGTNKGNVVTVPYQYAGLLLDVNKLTDVLSQYGGAVLSDALTFSQNLPTEAQVTLTEIESDGVTLSVWADGAHTYQWFTKTKDNMGNYGEWTKIQGASRNSYTYKTTKGEQLQFRCVAYGVSGTATSNEITLTITDNVPPIFTLDLDDSEVKEVVTGKPLTLEVFAGDTESGVSYQWYKYGADSDKEHATAISGATSKAYDYNPAEAEIAYIFCRATNTQGSTDSKAVKVKSTFRDIKFHMYANYDATAKESSVYVEKGTSNITEVGTINARITADADGCKAEANRTNEISGLRFENAAGTEHNNPLGVYAQFTPTNAIESGDKIEVEMNTSSSGAPNDNYGFYLCKANTLGDANANVLAKISIPTSAGKGLYTYTYTATEAITTFYLLPFVEEPVKNVNLASVVVYSREDILYDAVAMTKDLQDSYDVSVGKEINLGIEATDAASYQWYRNTEKNVVVDEEHKISGATSSTYSFTPDAEGTYYYYCHVIGLKSGTSVTSNIAAVVATVNNSAVVTYAWDHIKDGGIGVSEPADIMSEMSVKVEGTLGWYGKYTYNNIDYGCAKTTATTVSPNDAIKFVIAPKEGKKFLPTILSFGAIRLGTDGGDMDVYVNGMLLKEMELGKTTVKPGRNNSSACDGYNFKYDLSDFAGTLNEPLDIAIIVKGMSKDKQWGIANLQVDGSLKDDVVTDVANPKTTVGAWVPAEEAWHYTIATTTEGAYIHYQIGDADSVKVANNSVELNIGFGQSFKYWASDPTGTLKNSKTKTETSPAMRQLQTPTINRGTYAHPTAYPITITNIESGAKVFYTTDGTTPTAESTEYTAAFNVGGEVTISAIAVKEHYANSNVISATTHPVSDTGTDVIVKSDVASNNDYVTAPYTVASTYVGGAANNLPTGIKMNLRTIDEVANTVRIDVNPGFVITGIKISAINNYNTDAQLTNVKVDGGENKLAASVNIPTATPKVPVDVAPIENITARQYIDLIFNETANDTDNKTHGQINVNIEVTYEFDDEPSAIRVADYDLTDAEMTEVKTGSHTHTMPADKVYADDPEVLMTTKLGYQYVIPGGDVDDEKYTSFTKTMVGIPYTVRAKVSAMKSPNIDIRDFSIKGGYKVELSGIDYEKTTPYINLDGETEADGETLKWTLYDPEKDYYALKTVKSKVTYTEDDTQKETEPRIANCPDNSYEAGKPFAVFVRQPSYLDSQDGSNPYNSVEPEATDKIYQALKTNFNVVDCITPSSTQILDKMPEIADAKLVVITEMISGSGSFAMQRPQDKEVQDSKSTALTMTLLRDVVDKTNVLNFKMFTYSQSKNNTDRWGWAQPAALPSNIISINPVEPNGGGMFELFSEAKMNLDGTIALWDNINEDKSVNHLQPVFNFNEAETTPSFIPLAMAVDPDNDEEQYHILHYYDKTTNGKKTTYVGFGLSVNEWTAYNDNVKAIIEKIGAMIIADRPLNTKLDHIVNPKITDNGDGSAMVMNNNFSAKTYYLAVPKDESGSSAPGAEVIERDGTQTTVDNNFNTIKYTTDMVIYAVSKLGDAYSAVVSDTLKGSTTRYITRINDDPEATGLVARYPFEVNTDGTAKTFSFPYNQSWKKDGYTVTKWIAEDGTEYIPGTSCSTLTQDITVKAVWEENKHQITDLSREEDKPLRTVKWEFLQSKGAPALAMEHKAGEMQAVIVGQVKFKDGTWLDVPMTINTDNNATLPDNGISYHGKFNNVSINWMPSLTDGDKNFIGSDYAQVRTGTQFTFPSVYGMNVVYKQVDLIERDLTTHEANGNINRSQVSQSYLTDGTIDENDATNYWRFVNPGYQLTGWEGEVLQPNSKIVFDGDAALLAHKSPITEKYKNQGANLVLYDEDTPGHTIGGNANYGGLINYTGEGKMATLTSVESAQYIHVGSSKKLGALNYGSVFMQSLEVTYPALYDLSCTWIAVGNEENPNKSELDPTENPGKIEKLSDSHANCNGRFNLDYPVLLKLTPAYGYYVDVDNDEVKDGEGKVTTPAYYFLKNGKLPMSPLSLGTNEYIHRYCDLTDDEKATNDAKPATDPDRIPVEGANIRMIVRDIDLVVSMKKYDTYSYDITPYRQDYGVIEYNTGTGRKTEDEYNTFPVGKTIVISATPKIGYKFTEWRYNPTTDDPTQSGTVLSNVSSLTGVTLGNGTSPNPNAAGDLLEKNQLQVVVSKDNSGNEHKYYAIFDKGVPGIAHYQFNYALEEYVDENGVTQTRPLTLTEEDINAFPTTFPSTALNIPRYYSLFKEGYTLDHWIDNSTNHETEPTAGSKVYRIGTFYYFETKDEDRYLVPVFRKNVISYDHRAQPVDITWDFRTSRFAQEMQFIPDAENKDKMIYYSTHATINNEHLMDVPLKITLGSKGKLKNNTDDEWCSIGEGSEIVIPSGIGAKFTVVSLSKMTSTQFIEKDAFGNVVNSTIPTSYTTKEENGVTVYYYTFTTESTSTDITLKIGNDYSYYKYIRAELPAADAVPLETTVNNPSFGTVEITAARSTADKEDNAELLKTIQRTAIEDRNNSVTYTLGLGTTVTLTSKRTHQHVVDYFEDIYGTKYYWDATKAGNIRAISADGKDVSEAARNSYGISMAKAKDFMNADNDFALTFIVTAYRNLMHVHYKENTLYQINYTSGDEAEGEAPGVKVIEAGESFKVPNENHYLYIDGQTLKYWEDEKGNKYDFGQSYTPGQLFTNTTSATLPSGLAVGESFTVPLDNLFLTPHFDVNDFTIMNLTEEATAVWPLTREGKSGSADSKADFAGNDGVVIYFQKSVGIYVTPLKLKDGRFIDLKVDIDCAKAGKVDNQSLGDRCQINGESTISLPSSSNCAIKLYTINGKLSTTKIAGATATEECKDNNDKVITTKYTSTTVSGTNEVAAVDYTGESTKVDIEFMGEAGYFYQIEAIYKPVQTTLPKLDNVTINNIALGALGTYLSDKKLSTLKSEGHLDGVAADLRTSKSGNMPVVKAAADNGGYVEITQATIDKPVATLLVKTAEGVTVSVHKISFTVTPPENAPIITDVKIGTKYQCDIEVIDADAIYMNTNWKWDDIYPEGSYIYGYKDKSDSQNKTTGKYLKNVENVGINGAISIRFNKPMKAVSMVMKRLKGQTISAEEGQTLVFSYWNLDLDTQYKDTIPAGTFEDIYGNKYNHPVVLQFKTVENALTVESRLINFVVTHNQPAKWNQETLGMVADGEPEKIATDELINNLDAAGIPHGTLNEGIAMANAAKDSKDRFYIFVPDGEYQLMGNTSINASYASNTYPPADNTGMLRAELVYKDNGGKSIKNGMTEIARDNISITGQSEDKTIVWNRPEIEGISYTATFRLNNATSNFYAQDMTWENRFDFKTSIAKQGAASAQAARAVVLQDRSAKSIFKNIKLLSYQDTYYSNPTGKAEDTRYYFENCTLAGYVDFLCGSGDVWLEKCNLMVRGGKGTNASNIMAPAQYDTDLWGYVFNHCDISAEEEYYNINNGKFTLARPWQNQPAASLLYTTYHVLPTNDGYKAMSKTGQLLRIHEYRSYLPDSTLVDLSQRSLRNSSPGAGSYDAVMTPSEAARYTVFNAMGGTDGYDPTIYTRQVNMDKNPLRQDDTSLSWEADDEALCYFIFRQETETGEWKLFAVTDKTDFELDDNQLDRWFYVRAANQRGGLGLPTEAYQYKAHESYKRELANNNQVVNGYRWSTIYLDFNAKAPIVQHEEMVDGKSTLVDDIYVYALVEIGATELKFQRVKTMAKNCGYLIKAVPRAEDYVFKYTEKTPLYYYQNTDGLTLEEYREKKGIEPSKLPKLSLMNGSVVDRSSTGLSGYTLSNKAYGLGFYKYTGSKYNANYAWIDAAYVAEAQKNMADVSAPDASAARAGFMKIVFDDDFIDDNTTGINGIREYEISDDAIYNLSGQRINPSQMQRGMIYIIGGKKVKY